MNLTNRDIDETQRSTAEAHRRREEDLLADPRNIARYMNPPRNTIYPLEYAYHLMGDVRGKTVLDFGCGAGENSLILACLGAKVIGLDLSPDLIGIARQRAQINGQSLDFVVSSAYKTGLQSESIDVVFGEAILHHLDLKAAASEIRRILRPTGYAVFTEPVRDSAILRHIRAFIPYQHPDVSPHEYPLTQKQINSFAQGFRVSGIRRFQLPFTRLALVLTGRAHVVKKIAKTDQWLLDTIPWFGHFAALTVFRMDVGCEFK